MQTPEQFPLEERDEPYYEPEEAFVRPAGGFWSLGRRVTWVSALVLTLSSFTGWYAGSSEAGPTVSVIGWHTGVLGKLIFFVGLVLLALAAAREFGFELPPSIPESLVVIALGSLATIFVLIRIIDIPDSVDRSTVHAHSDSKFWMIQQCFADFQSTLHCCFHCAEKDQGHSITA